MKRQTTLRLVAATPLIALIAACGGETRDGDGAVAPEGDAPAEIAERQDNFEAIGDSFKAIREQMEGGSPDFAAIETSATDINTRLQRLPELFPAGSSMEAGYDTEALAVIWEDPDGFSEAIENAVVASAELIEAAQTGDPEAVGGQIGELGLEGCKGCHDKFRKDDD